MLPLQFVIYDDSREAADTLRELLQPLLPVTVRVDCAQTQKQAETLIQAQTNIVFQDIQLGTAENGIGFAKRMQERFPQLRFVFITAYTEYYEQVFTVKPLAFLQKPFRQEGIQICMELIREHLMLQKDQMTVKLSKNHVRTLELEDVAFIENSNRRLLFCHPNSSVKYTLRLRMDAAEAQLPPSFVRCHYSFCVNMNYIAEMQRSCFILKSGKEVPISARRLPETKDTYIAFLGGKLG